LTKVTNNSLDVYISYFVEHPENFKIFSDLDDICNSFHVYISHPLVVDLQLSSTGPKFNSVLKL